MRHRRRSYHTYRGRMSAADKLRIAAGILLLLLLLVTGGLLFGQRYIVYTQDGLRLDLPFLQQEQPGREEEVPPQVTVVVEPVQEAQAPQEEVQPLRAVKLALDAVLDGTALEQARAQGANAIVLEMKDDWGNLGYCSAQSLAAQVGADQYGAEMNEAIALLAEEDIVLVAQISCFRDHAAASEMRCAIETNPGRRWSDADVVRWSNPAKQPVREYLSGIVQELARLGFDEILLEHWGYPAQEDGHLEYIKPGADYDPEGLEGVISSFLAELEDSLQDTGAVLSLRGDSAVLNGTDDRSGRTLEQLTGISGHIWAAEGVQALPILERVGVEHAREKLVELRTALTEGSDISQAVL